MNYGKSVTTLLSYDEAVERTKSLLKGEGFGVLCDIDVSKTLREKARHRLPPIPDTWGLQPDVCAPRVGRGSAARAAPALQRRRPGSFGGNGRFGNRRSRTTIGRRQLQLAGAR